MAAAGGLPFAHRAKELLMELKRSDWLPVFNDDYLRKVVEEVNALYKQANAVARSAGQDGVTEIKPAVLLLHTSAKRNKRCALAYLRYRLERLVEMRWESGSAIPDNRKSKLSAEEIQYFGNYDTLLGQYMRATDMDLSLDLKPPKNLYVEVRVLKECGMMTLPESGDVNLERNTNHFLRRSDVEHLVRQGLVQQIS